MKVIPSSSLQWGFHPHHDRAPFNNSLRALSSVEARSASEWRGVFMLPREKDAKTLRNSFPGQQGVRLAEGDPRYDLERARFESSTHSIHNWRARLELVRKMLTRWRCVWSVCQRFWRVDRWGIFITLKDFFYGLEWSSQMSWLCKRLWRATWIWDIYILWDINQNDV